jgi:hypothetical protein
MKLIDGKFYKDGKCVPLEFGNKEQIELIKKFDDLTEAMKSDGIVLAEHLWIEDIDGNYIQIIAPCVCGREFEINFPASEQGPPIRHRSKCSCNKEYVVFESEWTDMPCIKFYKQKKSKIARGR